MLWWWSWLDGYLLCGGVSICSFQNTGYLIKPSHKEVLPRFYFCDFCETSIRSPLHIWIIFWFQQWIKAIPQNLVCIDREIRDHNQDEIDSGLSQRGQLALLFVRRLWWHILLQQLVDFSQRCSEVLKNYSRNRRWNCLLRGDTKESFDAFRDGRAIRRYSLTDNVEQDRKEVGRKWCHEI